MTTAEAVAGIWNYRRRVELEAAAQFEWLSKAVIEVHGKNEISELAEAASKDETNHSDYCEKIVKEVGFEVTDLHPDLQVSLGPQNLNTEQRVLYAAVALSCVTETLSTALLIQMQDRAKKSLIRDVVHAILEDEIAHSRLGWAHLARESTRRNVKWLAPYIRGMIQEAVQSDVKPMLASEQPSDLSEFGILPAIEARKIMQETIETVILPGLRKFGIT